MPHPQLPQRTVSPDPTNNDDTGDISKDMHDGSFPFCSQSMLLPTPQRESLQSTSMSMATTVHEFLHAGNYQNIPVAMTLEDPQSMFWASSDHIPLGFTSQDGTVFGAPPALGHSREIYGLPQNGLPYQDSYSLEHPTQYLPSSFLRSHESLNFATVPQATNMSESYPPAVYQIEPPKHPDGADPSDQEIDCQLIQLNNDYECLGYHDSQIRMKESHEYQSPFSDRTRASTPPDEPNQYSHSAYTEGDGIIDKELPYAQLIYQALMGAPEKTMVLRDIYDWFKKHTDKASSSETKGWQNSIRHNLSMNGAFEKVDQPCEESRKGFMWRLTKEAIRDGVKSTTRYRSKQPAKRSYRAAHCPQPQRQASGSKGGQAARRSARMRRSNRASEIPSSGPCLSALDTPRQFNQAFYNGEPPTPYAVGPYGENDSIPYHSVQQEDYNSPLMAPHLELHPAVRIYQTIPMSHEVSMSDPHYRLDQGPAQRLFTNSPSPSADEPRTPESPGGWNEELSLGAPYVFDDMAYRAYAG